MKRGFTLIELLVVLGIIAVLAAIVIVALNPARQFALARNTQRTSNVLTILDGVQQRMAEDRGIWDETCGTVTVTLPTTATNVGSGVGLINLEPCLVPTYIPGGMVFDPREGDLTDTAYTISTDATTGVITVAAPEAELGETISIAR